MSATAIKFQRKTIKLAVNTEKDVFLPALESGGLAVHRAWNYYADKPSEFYWVISHFSSGMALSTKLSTRKAALAATEKILALNSIDWVKTADEISGKTLNVQTIAPVKTILREAECLNA